MSQPCPYCGSLEFEEENGVLVCTSCGRQQEGGLQVADDDADFGTQGKIARRKVERVKVKVTKIYRGAQAYKLYLQAWQHIMWRQSYALIHGTTKIPSELWIVARDLWTLKLSTLTHRFEGGNTATDDEYIVNSVDHDASSTSESGPSRNHAESQFTLKLWDTISINYLAALMIRHPILLSQVYSLIRSEEVPFIRAIRFVPYEMISHLPSEYQLALDTTIIPQPQELQQAVFRLIQSFSKDFGMEIPALNWKILLYEWIVELGLPLEVYNIVKHLAQLLEYDFTYQIPTEKAKDTDPDSQPRRKTPRRTPVAMPELQLISLIIVATKLLFPFPVATSSSSPNINSMKHMYTSPTNLNLNWSTWLSLHTSHTKPSKGSAKHIETTDRDIADMTPEDIDAYIAWYQNTFSTPDPILRQNKTDLEMSILDMFPVPQPSAFSHNQHPTSSETPHSETLCAQIQSQALRYTPNPTPSIYPIFQSLDDITIHNSLFDPSKENDKNPILYFHELAAKTACTDLKGLFRAVRYTENRMEGWITDRRREDVLGVDVDLDLDPGKDSEG